MKSKTFHRKKQLQILNLKLSRNNQKLRLNSKFIIPLDHFVIDPYEQYLVDINFYQPKPYNYAFFNPNNQKVYRFNLCSYNIDAYNYSKNIVYLGQGYPLYSYEDVHNAKNKSFTNMKVKHFWVNTTLSINDNYEFPTIPKNYEFINSSPKNYEFINSSIIGKIKEIINFAGLNIKVK